MLLYLTIKCNSLVFPKSLAYNIHYITPLHCQEFFDIFEDSRRIGKKVHKLGGSGSAPALIPSSSALCLEWEVGEVGEHVGREQEEEDPDDYRPLGEVYHQRMSSRQSQR